MIITIASGKGGTGKTTVATNLATILAKRGRRVQLLDCDVEEPNCHIFVKPNIERVKTVYLPVPKVDAEKCTGCGECGEICQYSAIVCMSSRNGKEKKVLTFPELCHSCGGCSLVCPVEAITEVPRELGVVEIGIADGFAFAYGRLTVGEATSPPLIRKAKMEIDPEATAIIDAPPGTSCPAVEAVKGSDYVLLVTEPTPFGLNDLRLAVAMAGALRLPMGIVINRSDIGDGRVRDYCQKQSIRVLAEIPDDRRVAEAYSRGEIASCVLPDYQQIFDSLLSAIEREAGK